MDDPTIGPKLWALDENGNRVDIATSARIIANLVFSTTPDLWGLRDSGIGPGAWLSDDGTTVTVRGLPIPDMTYRLTLLGTFEGVDVVAVTAPVPTE